MPAGQWVNSTCILEDIFCNSGAGSSSGNNGNTNSSRSLRSRSERDIFLKENNGDDGVSGNNDGVYQEDGQESGNDDSRDETLVKSKPKAHTSIFSSGNDEAGIDRGHSNKSNSTRVRNESRSGSIHSCVLEQREEWEDVRAVMVFTNPGHTAQSLQVVVDLLLSPQPGRLELAPVWYAYVLPTCTHANASS